MRSLVEHSGRPLSMTVQQVVQVPDRWREMAAWVADGGRRRPADARPRSRPRPVGVLQGLQASVNPFALCPSFQRDRPTARWPSGSPRCATPSAGGGSSTSTPTSTARLDGLAATIFTGFDKLFPMADPVDYEPSPTRSIAARAAARGVDAGRGGPSTCCSRTTARQLLYLTLFNYAHGNLDDVREMLLSPNSVIGLCDAGAHCGAICDASFPTTALSLWTQRRPATGRCRSS